MYITHVLSKANDMNHGSTEVYIYILKNEYLKIKESTHSLTITTTTTIANPFSDQKGNKKKRKVKIKKRESVELRVEFPSSFFLHILFHQPFSVLTQMKGTSLQKLFYVSSSTPSSSAAEAGSCKIQTHLTQGYSLSLFLVQECRVLH